MRKTIVVFLVVFSIFNLMACGKKVQPQPSTSSVKEYTVTISTNIKDNKTLKKTVNEALKPDSGQLKSVTILENDKAKVVYIAKSPILKDNQEILQKEEEVEDIIDNNKNDETKAIDNEKLTAYNKFVNDSYSTVFNDWIQTKEDGHLVYSPFSYKEALSNLTRITDNFNGSEYINNAKSLDRLEVNNITTGNLTMLNKDQFATDDNNIDVVEFPSEAAEKSKQLQQDILDEVLLEPEYAEDLSAVIVNATRFYGKWEVPFDKYNTEEDVFETIDRQSTKKDIMWTEDMDRIGYEDDKVTVGRKALKTDKGNSYVYFVSPKSWGSNKDLTSIAENISDYISKMDRFKYEDVNEDNIKLYDKVNLSVPKIDIKSNIDLLKAESEYGYKDLITPFKELDTIRRVGTNNEPLSISKITQVASMHMDEEEIEAKGVTEMQVKMTALVPERENILEVDCAHPHFIVTVSDGVISFIGFVGR